MRIPTAYLAAAGAAMLACAASTSAAPLGAAIALGDSEDFRYVQMKIFDGSAWSWNEPTGIFEVYNHDSSATVPFSQYYNDGQTIGVHLPDGAPSGGTHNHFAYGAFQLLKDGSPSGGEEIKFHAQIYDENKTMIWNLDFTATLAQDPVIGNELQFADWSFAGGTWGQETVIPLPTAGLMGLAGLGLIGGYHRRRA